jgi:hypothetical protein
MRTTRSLLAISTLLAALPAQDQVAPFRFVPNNSSIVMRMAAPAKWQQRFAGTQAAKLADGETMGPMMAQMRQGFEQTIEQLRASGKFDADAVEQLVTKYQGDIVLSVQIDFANLMPAIEAGSPPPVSVVVALSPDGKYDLGALAKAVEKMAEEESDGEPIRDLAAGDVRLRISGDDEMQVSLPTMIDGHLVIVASPQLDGIAAKLLSSSDRFSADAGGGQPLFVHAQVGGMVDAMMQVLGEQMDASGAPFDVAKVLRGLGLGAIDTLTMTLDAEGKHVAGEMVLQMKEGDRGLLAMLDGGKTAPKLLRLVPPGSEAFGVGHMALGKLYDTVGSLWGEFAELAGMDWTEAQTGFAEAMKVRLKEDLIDHLGTEILTLTDPEAMAKAMAEGDEEDPLAGMMGSCIGIQLRDGKAFAASLEKMLRSQGLHASRKTEEYQGTKIHRMPLAGMLEIEYSVTDELLLLALGKGESARQSLRAILDARATPAAEGEVPAKVKTLAATLPAGWNGLTSMSMSGMLAGMVGAMEAAMMQQMEEAPPEVEMMMQMMRGLGNDMKRLGIDALLSASYSTPNSFRSSMRW